MIALSEALKSNTSVTSLHLRGNKTSCFVSILTPMQSIRLNLKEPPNYLKHSNQIRPSKRCISPVADLLFHIVTHSIQTTILVMKVPSNYLKHSNQTHLLLHSISSVIDLLLRVILTKYRKSNWR
jgi:hypothetical protein